MITLYGVPRSRSLRVSWILEELGLNWAYHFVDFSKGENCSETFLALNASGKIPVLVEDKLVLTESVAIVQYLAAKYGGHLMPRPGTKESAQLLQWLSFITCELEQPLWTMGKHKFALPEELRQKNMLLVAKWEFEKAVTVANDWLPAQGYALGEFSVVDILLGQTLMWAGRAKLELPEKLNDYLEFVCQRPAFERALEKELKAAND
ncbi:glutathione S-transferase family protein [Shewanella gelidii]|uniref:Glutathione S-transferase n=1 Tax=Shewanella gelidii TaxID=1642821 RepID=A0A917JIQ3_9GAMM|nr:glutathione S-transferase family protein [Shewanella gelidii]MCL1096776.1 glutathione S-transferase family protein [Shewanella gelidii]GGI70086.1 glutathione S-transferase [Shewanella gelidii]